jgi:hypothetical protein
VLEPKKRERKEPRKEPRKEVGNKARSTMNTRTSIVVGVGHGVETKGKRPGRG